MIKTDGSGEVNHVDHFIFKTTHDLRAPLQSALGLIQIAEMEPHEYLKYLGMIRSSLLRLDAMITEMTSFYQNDKLAVQNERIDMRTLINREIENLKNMPEATDIRIDVFVDGEIPFYSDSIRLRTIISNLISNAIRYNDPMKMRKYIQVAAHIFIDKMFLTIEDNGIGIDEEHQKKIFDLFYRVTTDKKGTGLGLYIVKDTVDRLKGNIYLKSKKSESTSFTITLPNMMERSELN